MSDNVDRIWLVSNHKLGGFRCGMWTNDPNEIGEADVMYVRADLAAHDGDGWENRSHLASENVDELRAENAKLREENTYLAADGRHWREMYKNTAEALRKTQDALIKATDGE